MKQTNRQLKKLNLGWGTIYVEPYQSETNEEENRSKIYDELGNYLDYISTESITEQEYYNILADYLKATDIEDFIENKLLVDSYDCSESLENTICSTFETTCETDEDFEKLENDIKTKNEKDLMEEYCINKIGKWYFFLNI
nr:MAG TPA: hypothetical protein [Caudoviricetes sp.]